MIFERSPIEGRPPVGSGSSRCSFDELIGKICPNLVQEDGSRRELRRRAFLPRRARQTQSVQQPRVSSESALLAETRHPPGCPADRSQPVDRPACVPRAVRQPRFCAVPGCGLTTRRNRPSGISPARGKRQGFSSRIDHGHEPDVGIVHGLAIGCNQRAVRCVVVINTRPGLVRRGRQEQCQPEQPHDEHRERASQPARSVLSTRSDTEQAPHPSQERAVPEPTARAASRSLVAPRALPGRVL